MIKHDRKPPQWIRGLIWSQVVILAMILSVVAVGERVSDVATSTHVVKVYDQNKPFHAYLGKHHRGILTDNQKVAFDGGYVLLPKSPTMTIEVRKYTEDDEAKNVWKEMSKDAYWKGLMTDEIN